MNSISHMTLFLHSLFQPKKLAAYRILSIGKVIQYTFLLVLIMTAFSFGQFMQNGTSALSNLDELGQYAEGKDGLINVLALVFLFVMNTTILYAKISLYAFVIYLFAKSFNRKAEYRHLWRTTTFAITWEVLLTILLPIMIPKDLIITLLCIVVTMTILFIALSKYPKLKKA